MDWSKTLKWLADNPSAGPGGDPDLFDMPLPEGFPDIEGQEWPFAPEWDEQCEGKIRFTMRSFLLRSPYPTSAFATCPILAFIVSLRIYIFQSLEKHGLKT